MAIEYFLNNPDYTLRWPPELFANEAKRLVRRGETLGAGIDWVYEVKLLLRQAFESSVPAEDFELMARQGIDDEPF